MKTCRECRTSKPFAEFPLQPGGRDGRHPLCKPCRATQERRRYDRQRDAILAQMRADPSRKRRTRWRTLRRKYGLSRHDYETLVVGQRACCAICDLRVARLVVDHDHRTGHVRGLLCASCNIALGQLADDPERCVSAAGYLRATVGPPVRAGR